MSSRNRTFAIIVFAIAFLAVGAATYLFLRQPVAPRHSLLLYTSRPSPEMITNWIMDTDTGKKWEVGKGLATRGWSPSGKYLAFHALSSVPFEIWVSDSTGDNLRQVFDARSYLSLKPTEYEWLTDDMLIVNVVKDTQSYAYLLNTNTLTFEQIPNSSGFTKVSPNGQFWVEFNTQNKYSLSNLDGKRTSLPQIEFWDPFFSLNGTQVVYACAGEGKFSSLCLADININGITNERKFIDMRTHLYAFGEMKWSLAQLLRNQRANRCFR